MDLLSIIRGVWRRRVPAAIIVVLTLLGCGAVVVLVAPTHSATAYLVLLYPPSPPTTEEAQEHPEIAKINTNNPFLRFSDPSVVVQLLARKMDDKRVRRELKARGADENYLVAADNRYGLTTPIINVTTSAPDQRSALTTATLVSDRLAAELQNLQKSRGVDPYYMITVDVADMPDSATVQASGTIRALMAVLGLGGMTLLLTLAMLQAFSRFREERMSAPTCEESADKDDGPADNLRHLPSPSHPEEEDPQAEPIRVDHG